MTHSNRFGAVVLAIFAGIIGLVLAATSLAHNIEGVLPRISALPNTFEFYIQWTMEGGATVGLNMVALFGFTFASLMILRGAYVKSFGLVLVALLAMVWSGSTQLGVIAEKTFSVSGSNETAMRLYKKALADEAEIIAATPSFHKNLGQAYQDVKIAESDLKSLRYGNKTAWQTTNRCSGAVTAAASIKLCDAYRLAVRALEQSKYAADLAKRQTAVNAIIAKGPPGAIDAGPEIIAGASFGLMSVKTVQIILVFLRSFGIDLSAGLFLAACVSIWPTKTPQTAPLISDGGHDGGGVQSTGPVQPKPNSRVQSQRVIERLKQPVQNEHVQSERVQNDLNEKRPRGKKAEQVVLAYIERIAQRGEFKCTHRDVSQQCNIGLGNVSPVLSRLNHAGLIEYQCGPSGTSGRLLHAYA